MNEALNFQQIIDRIIGIVTLKDSVYEEIERDQSATTQAAVVVVLAGILAGIGATGDRWYSFVVFPVAALISWVISSYFIYLVGTRLIPSPSTDADLGQVLRLLGYATVTSAAGILGWIPFVGWIITLIAAILGIVLFVKAIMHAMEMDVPRAIGTALGAFFLKMLAFTLIAIVFGIGFHLF